MLSQQAQDHSSIVITDGKMDECNLLEAAEGRTESFHRVMSTLWMYNESLDVGPSSGRAPSEQGNVRYPGDLFWVPQRRRGLSSEPWEIVFPCCHIAILTGPCHPISVPVQRYELLQTHRSGGKEVSVTIKFKWYLAYVTVKRSFNVVFVLVVFSVRNIFLFISNYSRFEDTSQCMHYIV